MSLGNKEGLVASPRSHVTYPDFSQSLVIQLRRSMLDVRLTLNSFPRKFQHEPLIHFHQQE